MSKKNVFVFGLNAFNRAKLEALKDADQYRFHGLLDIDEVKDAEEYHFGELLREACQRLDGFDEPVDAIVNFWDFPASVIQPLLCEPRGLPSPSLEAVLKCGHKYLSRTEQNKVIPEYIPRFRLFDPFAENALQQIDLAFPFWIKPVQSYSGYLGFRIGNEADFDAHIQTIRNNIGRFAEPYSELLQHVDLHGPLGELQAHYCLAEEIITGKQCTVEGYSYRGEVETFGVIDSYRYPNNVSFSRYQYPSTVPKRIKTRIEEVSRAVVQHIGFDNSAFNIEYFYDRSADSLTLLEINTRISQSHADLFEKVDGTPNHQVVVDLALGQRPRFPHRQGKYNCAAKLFARRFRDAVVIKAPSAEDLRRVQEQVPDTIVVIPVKEGMRLSELLDQDSYSYQYAILYMGGKSTKELLRDYRKALKSLNFKFKTMKDATAP